MEHVWHFLALLHPLAIFIFAGFLIVGIFALKRFLPSEQDQQKSGKQSCCKTAPKEH